MGLINFKDIDFNKSINKELKTFEFNGSEIGVIPYLPIDEKYDFIMATLQKSFDQNVYNPLLLKMYFDLHLIYMYTDIVIDQEDKMDESKLYDIFTKSGLINKVKEAMDQEEIDILMSNIQELSVLISKYKHTFGATLHGIIESLPANMEKAKEIVESITPEKIEELTTFIKNVKE